MTLGAVARFLQTDLMRYGPWLIALATATGLTGGWLVRRSAFGPPIDDYPAADYNLLYACGFLGAVLSVSITSRSEPTTRRTGGLRRTGVGTGPS